MERKNEQNTLFLGTNGTKEFPSAIRSKESEWTGLLALAGAATTVGSSLSVGYTIGVVNAPGDIMKAFCNESAQTRYGSQLTDGELTVLWACVVSIFLVGGAVGSLSGSYLADKVGRKGGLLISSVLGTIAGVCFLITKVSNSIEIFILGRLLIGLASGLITSIVPMYLIELAPKSLSGSMGVFCPLGVTMGVLCSQILSLSQILGNEHYWPYCLAVYLVTLVPCSIVFLYLPESPKYLFVIKRKPQLAIKHLSRIRNKSPDYLEHEVHALKIELEENEAQQSNGNNSGLWKVITDKTLLLPLLLVCSLQAGQQFSGINAVFYYSVSTFKKSGLTVFQSQLANIGAGICNLFMAIVSITVMAKFNRRLILQLSLGTSAFFLFFLALAITYEESFTWMPYLSIVGVLGFVLCYGLGLGPIPYFIGSELFEVGPRPSAMALGSMSNWGGNLIIGIGFPMMQKYIDAASFFIFGLIVLVLYAFVRFYLPETRGKDVSEVAALCRDGFNSSPLTHPVNHSTNQELNYSSSLDT